MKPKLITSILLFISAYSPLSLILTIRDIDFKCSHRLTNPITIEIILGITILSIIVLFAIFRFIKPGDMSIKILSAKNKSVDIIGYTVPYMVAFFGVDLAKPEDVISLIIFLLVLFLLTVTSKAIFLNPILVIAGYGLYDIEYEFSHKTYSMIVISKLDLQKGDDFNVRSLTRFLYFVKQKETETIESTTPPDPTDSAD